MPKGDMPGDIWIAGEAWDEDAEPARSRPRETGDTPTR